MTTPDFDRTARLWLDDGPTELSDRVLQAALREIHLTPQRRAPWPARRFPSMTGSLRLAAVLGAVVLALAGVSLLGPPSTGPGGVITASPSVPTPSTVAPSNLPSPITLTTGQEVTQPGTYVSGKPFPVAMSFTLPPGWTGTMGGAFAVFLEPANNLGSVDVVLFQDVYADPCHADAGLLEPLPGASVDDLAAALAAMPNITATVPTDVTFAGYTGKQLTITAPASFASCSPFPSGFRIWMLPLGATYDMSPGETDRIWILDVGGKRVVISVPETSRQTASGRLETQAVLDSVRFALR